MVRILLSTLPVSLLRYLRYELLRRSFRSFCVLDSYRNIRPVIWHFAVGYDASVVIYSGLVASSIVLGFKVGRVVPHL